MNETHYQKLRHMYLSANINRMLYETTSIVIGEGNSEIGLELSEKYFHALGAMHGSVYFKLLDDACFFAVNSLVDDVFVLTTAFDIQLKRPENRGKIVAKGHVTECDGATYHAVATLYNASGKELAKGKGTFVKSKQRLRPEIGYFLKP